MLFATEVSGEKINAALQRQPQLTAFSVEMEAAGGCTLLLDDAPFFVYDAGRSTAVIRRAHENNCFAHAAYATTDSVYLNAASLKLFFDANSLEIFDSEGDKTLSYLLFPGVTADRLRFKPQDFLKSVIICDLTINR